jgi:hypothetical protein
MVIPRVRFDLKMELGLIRQIPLRQVTLLGLIQLIPLLHGVRLSRLMP